MLKLTISKLLDVFAKTQISSLEGKIIDCVVGKCLFSAVDALTIAL